MRELLHKSHNVSALLYHAVCPTKYRRAVITDEVEAVLRRVCIDISNRYEIMFLEIGVDSDHVHFLVQSVPISGSIGADLHAQKDRSDDQEHHGA